MSTMVLRISRDTSPEPAETPPLPKHLEGCPEVCGYSADPAKPWETACGRTVVPFSPVSRHRGHVTCPVCVTKGAGPKIAPQT